MLHATWSWPLPCLHPSPQVRQGGLITGTSLDNALIPKPKIPGGDLAGLINEDTGKVALPQETLPHMKQVAAGVQG